jgi:hypothetical protein
MMIYLYSKNEWYGHDQRQNRCYRNLSTEGKVVRVGGAACIGLGPRLVEITRSCFTLRQECYLSVIFHYI